MPSLPSDHGLLSPPRLPVDTTAHVPRHTSPERASSKEKRQPSITPRKFTRFFTPRSHGPSASGSSRRVLFDVTAPANNRNGIQSSPIRSAYDVCGQENSPVSFTREMKRRKLLHTPNSSPEPSITEKGSPCDIQNTSHGEEVVQGQDMPESLFTEDFEKSTCEPSTYPDYNCDLPSSIITEEPSTKAFVLPIRSIGSRGLAGSLLRMRLGSNSSRRRTESYPISGE